MSPKTTVRLALATTIAAVSLAYLNKPVDAQLATPEIVDPDLGRGAGDGFGFAHPAISAV